MVNFALPFPEIYPVIRRVIHPTTGVYLVGGCVRDLLLGREPQDIDMVLTSDVRKVSRALSNHFNGAFYALDNERETMRVLIEHQGKKWKIDIALLRGEDLEDDLRTRDFTVNAMAIDVLVENSGKMIDFFDGLGDLQTRKLRTCSKSSIQDDPIRILRGVRLGLSLDFHLEASSKLDMCKAVHLLDVVSAERKRDEIFKLFAIEQSSRGLAQLVAMDAFPVLFPECLSANLMNEAALTDLISKINSCGSPCIAADNANVREYLQTNTVEERSFTALLKLASLFMFARNYSDVVEKLTSSFALSNRESAFLNQVVKGQQQLMVMSKQGINLDDVGIYRFYQQTANAGVGSCLLALVSAALNSDQKVVERVQKMTATLLDVYFNKYEAYITVQPLLDGNDLIRMFKLKPGPMFKEFLERLKEAQVSGKVLSKGDAERFIQTLLAHENEA